MHTPSEPSRAAILRAALLGGVLLFTTAAPAVAQPQVSLSDRLNTPESWAIEVYATLTDGSGTFVVLPNEVVIPVTVTRDTSEADDHATISSITIPAQSVEGSASIATIRDDDTDDEMFTVALDTANLPSSVVAGSTSSLQLTIYDVDMGPEVSLSLSPDPVVEGKNATITMTLSQALRTELEMEFTVPYWEEIVSASSRKRYSVRIYSGDTSGTAPIPIPHDDDTDDDILKVTLASDFLPVLVRSGSPSVATVRIIDDDAPDPDPDPDPDPTSVPALPLGGAVLLGLLLTGAGLRRRGRTGQ